MKPPLPIAKSARELEQEYEKRWSCERHWNNTWSDLLSDFPPAWAHSFTTGFSTQGTQTTCRAPKRMATAVDSQPLPFFQAHLAAGLSARGHGDGDVPGSSPVSCPQCPPCSADGRSGGGRGISGASVPKKTVPSANSEPRLKVPMVLDGKKVSSKTSTFFDVHNPATGETWRDSSSQGWVFISSCVRLPTSISWRVYSPFRGSASFRVRRADCPDAPMYARRATGLPARELRCGATQQGVHCNSCSTRQR